MELEKVGYGLKELVMTHHMEDEAGIEYALFVTNEKKVLLVSRGVYDSNSDFFKIEDKTGDSTTLKENPELAYALEYNFNQI